MTIPTKMRALILKGDGYSGTAEGPAIPSLEPWLDLKTVDVPKPDIGQVLIKVIQSGVNPSDLHFIKGEYGIPRVKGTPAGFEGCGTVVAAGKGGEGLVGQRVGFIATGSGAWAEYAISDIKSCFPVHPSVSDDDAAALYVNPLTAIAMVEEVKATGTKCFILSAAASQLCKLMIGLAKQEGLHVIALVRHDEQMSHLTDLGATHVLNVTSDGFMPDMLNLMREEKPGVFLDAVADQTCSDIFAGMPNKAEWVIYGKLSTQNPTLTQPGQFIFMSKKIRGFWLTKWLRDQDKDTAMAAGMKVQQLFGSGAWKTEVAAKVKLADAHGQLPKLTAKANEGKIMILGE
ncbi:MAG: zinc-binding dehydrogenase [Salaquimonas sp.]